VRNISQEESTHPYRQTRACSQRGGGTPYQTEKKEKVDNEERKEGRKKGKKERIKEERREHK
jgi:hypothetical protein